MGRSMKSTSKFCLGNLHQTYREISVMLWEGEANYPNQQIKYDDETFAATTKIFMSSLMSKMYDFQEKNDFNLEKKIAMAQHVGSSLRELILQTTGVDMHKVYKND